MITTTWTKSPADLLGLGGVAMFECAGLDRRTLIGVSPAPRVAPFQGTGVPAGGIAARLRPEFQPTVAQAQVAPIAHNSIVTTLGFSPSRRPLS
jgi:hypothetical protein